MPDPKVWLDPDRFQVEWSKEQLQALQELMDSEVWQLVDKILLSHLEGYNNDLAIKDSYVDLYRAQGAYNGLNRLRNSMINYVEQFEEEQRDEELEAKEANRNG